MKVNKMLSADSRYVLRRVCSAIKMTCLSYLTLLLVMLALPAIAQQSTKQDLIDGSLHPELISDTTAYRLFFATYSGKDEAHRKLQSALFKVMQLPAQDCLVLTNTLDDFGVRFQKILDDDAVDVIQHPGTDHLTFHLQRDSMMDDTLASIKLSMSAVGFKRLDA